MIELLEERGATVWTSDTHIAEFKHHGLTYTCEELTEQRLREADIAVIATDHSGFDYELIGRTSRCLLDTRNAMKNQAKPERYYLL